LRISCPYLILFSSRVNDTLVLIQGPMDMNGYEGIFRVSIDVYQHSCGKLECLGEGDEFGFFVQKFQPEVHRLQ
jgi:hypothetical protein